MGFLDKLLGRTKETASTVAEKASPAVDKAGEVASSAFDKAKDVTKETASTVAEKAAPVVDKAGEVASSALDKAKDVVAAYAKAFPDRKPVEIWSLVSSNRQSTVALADAKSKQEAPVYLAWFGWQPPLFDGRMRAFHCLDICFWFHNTDLMYTHTGGGARPRRLAEKMARTLLQFMKTGDANGGGLPAWPRYTAARGETMVLDDAPAVRDDPDREARKALPPLA